MAYEKVKHKEGSKKPGTVQPGEVRNPHGRPKRGETLTDLLRELLEEKHGEKQTQGKALIIKKLFAMAMAGDLGALKLVYDRIDGPVTTEIKNIDDEGNAIVPSIKVVNTSILTNSQKDVLAALAISNMGTIEESEKIDD